MVAFPTLTSPIDDLTIAANEQTQINLFDNFDDPFTTGLVATFDLFNPKETFPNDGIAQVLLFDQDGQGAPGTVANFNNYVEDGDYVNSIIHRSIPGFVVQGGGFVIDESLAINAVPTDDPIANEFSTERSNVEGTIAMAKLADDPDSATSQWFFNLSDNSTNINPETGEDIGLDVQNGGFTVFGELLSATDAQVVDAIAEIPFFDLSQQLGGAFTSTPIDIEDPNSPIDGVEDFVRYESITVSQQDELTFTITNNSNPDLVEATINDDGQLTLSSPDGEAGEADITVQATNLVGETVEDTFRVAVSAAETQVELAIAPTEGSEAEGTIFTLTVTASEAVTDEQTVDLTLSGSADADDFIEEIPDTIAIADGETIGSVEITVNDDDLVEGEETATFTISNPTDGIVLGETVEAQAAIADNDQDQNPDQGLTPAGDRVFRFFNTETGGHLYTADVAEREFITNQLPQFELEGVGFLAAPAGDPNATDVFRFFNTEEGQHFYTASEEEKDFVENNLPNFVFEGVAFSAYEEELPETTPVFRFFNAEGGGHFYTASSTERELLEENAPEFVFEGVGFFANDLGEGELV